MVEQRAWGRWTQAIQAAGEGTESSWTGFREPKRRVEKGREGRLFRRQATEDACHWRSPSFILGTTGPARVPAERDAPRNSLGTGHTTKHHRPF